MCVTHGGATRQVRAAAARRLARAEAVAELNVLGRPVQDADPGQMVLREVAHAAGHVDLLREVLGALDPDAAVNGAGRPYMDLYGDERGRLVKFSDIAARLGLAERQTVLAERVAGLVAALMAGVVADLELTAEQHARAAVVLPTRLRELQASLVLDQEGPSS